jgi:tRNA(adenine34) deaminase
MNALPFTTETSESDILCFQRAIQLALEAEKEGNLPIGAVISLDGRIIAQGKNAIWSPKFNANRHAEIEALRDVPEQLWESSRNTTLYTTLEPCLMCTGAILLHHIGRVMYGSSDGYGGASLVFGHMPTYFEREVSKIEWIGPAYAEECDNLFQRVMRLVEKRRGLGM